MKLIITILFFTLAFSVNAKPKNYGTVIVDEVISIYDADTFRVTIKDWPPLIEIDVADKVNKTTLEHISNTFNALALHPGRIYQGKHEDISPWSSFMRMFKQENKKSSEDETKN